MKENIIILGGNSSNNIKWIKDMEELYKINYNVYTIYYDNWKDNSDINLDNELLKLKELTKDLKRYIIIAKSVGIILTLKGIIENIISPKQVIFLGLPLYICLKENIEIEDMLNKCNNIKILVIEQKYDPVGNSKDVKNILNKNIDFKEIDGKDHYYGEIEYIKNIIDSIY